MARQSDQTSSLHPVGDSAELSSMRPTDRAVLLAAVLTTLSLLSVACGSVESEAQAQQTPVAEIVGEAPEISATHDLACAVAGEAVTIEFGEGSTYKTRPDATGRAPDYLNHM